MCKRPCLQCSSVFWEWRADLGGWKSKVHGEGSDSADLEPILNVRSCTFSYSVATQGPPGIDKTGKGLMKVISWGLWTGQG